MAKKFLSLAIVAIIISFSPSFVLAEQAAAEHYRQLINSGKFFLAYNEKLNAQKKQNYNADSDEYSGKKISYDGERKMSYSHSRTMDYYKSEYYRTGVYKKGAVFDLPNKILPNVLYQDGKYYQFYDKDKAIVGYEKDFSADYINPEEHWELVRSGIALPVFLGALLPNNPNIPSFNGIFYEYSGFKDNHKKISTLIESGTENIFGQNFNYDKYTVKFLYDTNVKVNKNGEEITDFSQTYIFYYDGNGKLCYVKQYDIDGKMTYISIDKFTEDIPTDFFNFPKGCQIYKMDTGTLSDLLGVPELVEQY